MGGDQPAKNSPTLIGAAIGTAGGPVWALACTGVANLASDFRPTLWNTLNVSAAMLLILVNVSLAFAAVGVAAHCSSLGKPGTAEFLGALFLTTPYVVYRSVRPCRAAGAGDMIAAALAPAALVRIAGGRA